MEYRKYTDGVKKRNPEPLHTEYENLLGYEAGKPVEGKKHIGNPAYDKGALISHDQVGRIGKNPKIKDHIQTAKNKKGKKHPAPAAFRQEMAERLKPQIPAGQMGQHHAKG